MSERTMFTCDGPACDASAPGNDVGMWPDGWYLVMRLGEQHRHFHSLGCLGRFAEAAKVTAGEKEAK